MFTLVHLVVSTLRSDVISGVSIATSQIRGRRPSTKSPFYILGKVGSLTKIEKKELSVSTFDTHHMNRLKCLSS